MKLIPRLKPRYSYQELLAALNVLGAGVSAFESAFARQFGCSYAVMFAYGRSGIKALLEIWDLKDSEVICPAYTCVVVPHAIVLSGNKPVFVDCEKGSCNMSLSGIQAAITEKTRVIVATHLFGYPMDVDSLEAIVREAEQLYRHKIYVIQDCAHSYGCHWKGELVTKRGDAAIFGLNISKIINSIFGGMVTTNDSETWDALNKYRKARFHSSRTKSIKRFCYFLAVNIAFNSWVYGFVNWLERLGLLDKFVKYYDPGVIDFPHDWDSLPCDLEARIGLIQLKKYERIVADRIALSKNWITQMKDQEISFFDDVDGCTYSHLVGLVDDREQWLEGWRKKGIQLGQLIEYVIPKMPAYVKYAKGAYPVAESYSERTVNFPIHGN